MSFPTTEPDARRCR